MATLKEAFTDAEIDLHGTIAEGDLVVARATASVVHSGAFMGAAPTHKRVTWSVTNTFRIEAGKIAEVWEQWDELGFFQQLGLLPPLPALAE